MTRGIIFAFSDTRSRKTVGTERAPYPPHAAENTARVAPGTPRGNSRAQRRRAARRATVEVQCRDTIRRFRQARRAREDSRLSTTPRALREARERRNKIPADARAIREAARGSGCA